jgi:glycosyltransferase involved in cell wall biosynthesis
MPPVRFQKEPSMPDSLSWSLVVCTYKRGPALRRCIELAMRQTRPPREVVVVDGSPNWQEIRDSVLDGTASKHPEIRWDYQEARIRSLPTQRNQAIDLATSDILFLIDDDSFMYPDCAAEVMKIYEADRQGVVAGVSTMLADRAPDDAGDSTAPGPAAADAAPPAGWLGRLSAYFEQQLEVEKLLLPYDRTYPRYALPDALKALDVAPTHYLHGMRMTYRRGPIQRERFEELLQRYAAGEDLDASYRVSRHGLLVNALRAQLFHARDPSGRVTRFTGNVLVLMNLAVLYRLKGQNPKAMLRALYGRVLKKVCIDVLRDLSRKRVSLPSVRADCFVLGMMGRLLDQDKPALRKWYPTFQNKLIDRNFS